MFCEEPKNPDMEISCSLKWVYEIISLFSLICSIFVVYATVKNIKMNIMHKLILQIIISEMLDEINILLSIVSDMKGRLRFENYDFRMYSCYTQIYLSVFSCLWTLTASLFISIKLYDIIINKNKIFKTDSFLNKYVNLISISAPLIISYIFWVISSILKADTIHLNSIYINKIQNKTQMIKLVFCWLNKEMSIGLAYIVAILIAGNIYFSIIKGYVFIRKVKDTILDQNDDYNLSNNNRIKSINQIEKILFFYPLIASIIWIIFFLFIFLFNYSYREHQSSAWSYLFCIFMAIRQIIYTQIYFLSQKKLWNYTFSVLKCETCKRKNIYNKGKGRIINPIKGSNDNNSINSDIVD